jgi:hypothetical protein
MSSVALANHCPNKNSPESVKTDGEIASIISPARLHGLFSPPNGQDRLCNCAGITPVPGFCWHIPRRLTLLWLELLRRMPWAEMGISNSLMGSLGYRYMQLKDAFHLRVLLLHLTQQENNTKKLLEYLIAGTYCGLQMIADTRAIKCPRCRGKREKSNNSYLFLKIVFPSPACDRWGGQMASV